MGNLRLVVPEGWDRVLCCPKDSDGDPVHVYNDGIGKRIEKIITTYDKPFENLFRHLPNNLQRISKNALNCGFPNNEEAIVKLAMLHDLCSLDNLNSNYSDSKFGVTHRVFDNNMTSYMFNMNNLIIVSGCPRRNQNVIEALEGLYDYDIANNLPHDTTIYCLFDDKEKSLLKLYPDYKVRYFMAVTRGVSEQEFISFFHNSFEVLPYSFESPLLKTSAVTPNNTENDKRKEQTKNNYVKPKRMGFVESIKTCLIDKYAKFDGRATRSEFWWFYLAYVIVLAVANETVAGIVQLIIELALIVPFIAVSCRRLHDVNKSEWFMLIPIYSLVLFCQKGTEGPNKYDVASDAQVTKDENSK